MKFGIIICIVIVILSAACFTVQANEMPFGVFYYVVNGGITTIERGRGSEILRALSNYNYAKIEAEERTSNVRMYNCGGEMVIEGDKTMWISHGGSNDIIFGPNSFNYPCEWDEEWKHNYIRLRNKYSADADPTVANDTIFYYIDIRARIDVSDGSDTVVAYLKIVADRHNDCARDTSFIWPLHDSDFRGSDTWSTITKLFHLADTLYCQKNTYYYDKIQSVGVKAIIETTGKREFSLDWIKIYDQHGYHIAESDCYRESIKEFVEKYKETGYESSNGWRFVEPHIASIPVSGFLPDTARFYGKTGWEGISLIEPRGLYEYWLDQVERDVLRQFIVCGRRPRLPLSNYNYRLDRRPFNNPVVKCVH